MELRSISIEQIKSPTASCFPCIDSLLLILVTGFWTEAKLKSEKVWKGGSAKTLQCGNGAVTLAILPLPFQHYPFPHSQKYAQSHISHAHSCTDMQTMQIEGAALSPCREHSWKEMGKWQAGQCLLSLHCLGGTTAMDSAAAQSCLAHAAYRILISVQVMNKENAFFCIFPKCVKCIVHSKHSTSPLKWQILFRTGCYCLGPLPQQPLKSSL